MNIMIFFVCFFLSLGSISFGQVYKYVDEKGTICFTDSPPASLIKAEVRNAEKEPERLVELVNKTRSRVAIKSILQLCEEALREEYAKPPEKRNLRLIREMEDILSRASSHKEVTTSSIILTTIKDIPEKICWAFGELLSALHLR